MVDWSKTESEIDRRIEKLEQELDLEIRTRKAAQDDVLKLEAKLALQEEATRRVSEYNGRLEAKLKGTVTTEYHDQIVQEAVTRAAKAEQKLERLMAGIKALEEKGDGK